MLRYTGRASRRGDWTSRRGVRQRRGGVDWLRRGRPRCCPGPAIDSFIPDFGHDGPAAAVCSELRDRERAIELECAAERSRPVDAHRATEPEPSRNAQRGPRAGSRPLAPSPSDHRRTILSYILSETELLPILILVLSLLMV